MVYQALLPLMSTPRLPVVDWTDATADLKGFVRFAERRNLVSARVPSHFNWPLQSTLHNISEERRFSQRQTRRRARLITTPLRCDMTNALVMEHPVIDYVVHFPSHLIPLPLHPQCVFISLAAFSSNSGSASFSLSISLNFIPASESYMMFCQTGLGQGPW